MSDDNLTVRSAEQPEAPSPDQANHPYSSNGGAEDSFINFVDMDEPLPDFGIDSDWLRSRNSKLHTLLLQHSEKAKEQTVMFNEVWQEYTRAVRARDESDTQRQSALVENMFLKNQTIQAQHLLAVERFQHVETQNRMASKDDAINSLRYQISAQQGYAKSSHEQLSQVTRILLAVANGPGAEESHSLIKTAYDEQVKENEKLREEIANLLKRLDGLSAARVAEKPASPKASSSVPLATPSKSQAHRPRGMTFMACNPTTISQPSMNEMATSMHNSKRTKKPKSKA